MKNILSAITFFAFAQCAFPQNIQPAVPFENQGFSVARRIKNTQAERPIYLNDINIKAVRDLKQAYKAVTNEKWYVMSDGFRANFTLNDIRYRLDYAKNGNWLHTIRYYDEKKLPLEIRRLVVSNYLDYTITLVEEIEKPLNVLSYIIHLEGQTNWINIKVCNGEIEEWLKFEKS